MHRFPTSLYTAVWSCKIKTVSYSFLFIYVTMWRLPHPFSWWFRTGQKWWSVGKFNAISHSWSFIPKESFCVGSCFPYKAWLVKHFKFSWHVLNAFCASEVLLLLCTCDVFALCVTYLLCMFFAWVTRGMICVNRITGRCVFTFAFHLKVLVCFSAAATLGSGMGSFPFLM